MSTVSRERFRNALRRMAAKAHEAITHVGMANYEHREDEAHRWIDELLERELAPRRKKTPEARRGQE